MKRVHGLALAVVLAASTVGQTQTASELAGLWEAHPRFGPDIRGVLTIVRGADGCRGEIAGRVAPGGVSGEDVALTLAKRDHRRDSPAPHDGPDQRPHRRRALRGRQRGYQLRAGGAGVVRGGAARAPKTSSASYWLWRRHRMEILAAVADPSIA